MKRLIIQGKYKVIKAHDYIMMIVILHYYKYYLASTTIKDRNKILGIYKLANLLYIIWYNEAEITVLDMTSYEQGSRQRPDKDFT